MELRFNQVRKAAVSLNNKAVTFLSIGHDQGAMDTLKDSVKLMNLASQVRFGCSRETTHEEDTTIRTALRLAQHRCPIITQQCKSERDPAPKIQSISNQTLAYALSKNNDFLCDRLPFPVVIDQLPTGEDDDGAFELECVIVLYNFGLSHHVLANHAIATANEQEEQGDSTSVVVTDALIQTSMRWSALSMLELSERLLSKIPECIQSTALLMGMLLMHSLIRVSLDLDRPVSKYRTTLSRLLARVQLQHRLFPAADEQCVAPAA